MEPIFGRRLMAAINLKGSFDPVGSRQGPRRRGGARPFALLALLLLAAGVALPPPGAVANSKGGNGQLSAEERKHARKYLLETKERLLAAIGGLSEEQLSHKPDIARWSIAETVEHIIVAEQRLLELISGDLLRSPAAPDGKESEVEDSTVIESTADRSRKFQAPAAVRPTGRWQTKPELVKEFEKTRAASLKYVETTTDPLKNHFAPNPAVARKEIDGYQWLLFMTAHCERHTKQIVEAKSAPGFPKGA